MIQSVNELIAAFGSGTALAREIGVGKSAVSNWRRFGRVPPRLYIKVSAKVRERGYEVSKLLFVDAGDARRALAAQDIPPAPAPREGQAA